MTKFKFTRYIDLTGQSLLLLLFFFVWCRYFMSNLTLALLTSTALALVACFALYKKSKAKQEKANNAILETRKLENFKTFLLYEKTSTLLDFIQKDFGGKQVGNTLVNGNKIYVIFRGEKPLSKDDIYPLLQSLDTSVFKSVTIASISVEPSCKIFLESISNVAFSIETLNNLTKYFNEKNTPLFDHPKYEQQQKAVFTLKSFFILLLRPKNTKGYVFSALIIIFASFVTAQKIYYLIFASVLLLLALFSKIFKQAN